MAEFQRFIPCLHGYFDSIKTVKYLSLVNWNLALQRFHVAVLPSSYFIFLRIITHFRALRS